MSTRREFFMQAGTGVVMSTSMRLAQGATEDTIRGSRAAIKKYKIPHTDLIVSRIAYGCAMLGVDWNSSEFVGRIVATVNAAYDQGITFFDLADVYGYGKAEIGLGKVLRESPGLRRNIVIQSKCGDTQRPGVPFGVIDSSRDYIVRSVEDSLKRLGTDYIDLLLLHWPDHLVQPNEVAWAFDDLERSGKVRYFGVSNHSIGQIELLKKCVRQPLVANQIRLGLAHAYALATKAPWSASGVELIVDYCRLNGIQIQAYSTLRGLLKPPANVAPELEKITQVLADLAGRRGTTPSAVALAWLLHHPAEIVPIIGASEPRHVIDNCMADAVVLTRDEWYTLLWLAISLY